MNAIAAADPASIAASDHRFEFGANWRRFLSALSEDRIAAAVASLQRMLGERVLTGKRFLDIGSGSGLFSLAAYRLGATVHSFDYDPESVGCTQELRQRAHADPTRWHVEQGSVLDAAYLQQLGEFDIVYSWGVLHHTGSMWTAIDLAAQRVAPGGQLWIAIYNDQGLLSGIWTRIKQIYVRLPNWLRGPYVGLIGGAWAAYRLTRRGLQKALASLLALVTLNDPVQPWRKTQSEQRPQAVRGMHPWYDLVDWIGGYPFEVATPEAVFRFLRDRGFRLTELATCGGMLGCNEFVFDRPAVAAGLKQEVR
jgi:SAM-dependent methyltransferase